MSGFDYDAAKKAQEDLMSRGGGSKLFTRLDKENLTKDIRILEPTPSMNGLYWIEVPIWWVDGKPITSPEFVGEGDVVQEIMDAFENEFGDTEKGKAEWKALRYASKGQGRKNIQKTTGFWIPVLEFEWKFDKDGQIEGIYDGDDYDVTKIKQFVKDGKAKILDCKVSLLKNINSQIITGRDGKHFLDREKGFNILISRAGEGTDTTYSSTKQESMPMPEDFYGDGALDLVEVAKAGMYTDDYIEKVLAKYFFGEADPGDPEYRFPELRKKFSSEDGESSQPATRSRRRAKLNETKEEKKEEAAPTGRTRRGGDDGDTPRTRGRGRSLVNDAAAADE